MRVGIVSPYDLGLPGGVQDQVIRLSGWLNALGHESIVVGPGVEGPPDAVLLGATRLIKANRAATPIAVNPRISRRLKEVLADVDVVHVHEPLMPTVGTAATSIKTHPTVGTFHADPPRWARYGYKAGSRIWRRVISRLDVVTTVSHVSAAAIAPFVSAREIPNGIDVHEYGGQTKVPNRIAFLGRDDERKGLQVLLDAWPAVRSRIPEAELVVIGANRDESIEGVVFKGRLDTPEKNEALGSAEVFCAPNLGGESFGIVVAEGMASGCAIVASAIPAFVAVLGESGILVSPGDPVGLADALISVLTDRSMLESKRSLAIASVERFDGLKVAALYVKAYEHAVAVHGS